MNTNTAPPRSPLWDVNTVSEVAESVQRRPAASPRVRPRTRPTRRRRWRARSRAGHAPVRTRQRGPGGSTAPHVAVPEPLGDGGVVGERRLEVDRPEVETPPGCGVADYDPVAHEPVTAGQREAPHHALDAAEAPRSSPVTPRRPSLRDRNGHRQLRPQDRHARPRLAASAVGVEAQSFFHQQPGAAASTTRPPCFVRGLARLGPRDHRQAQRHGHAEHREAGPP